VLVIEPGFWGVRIAEQKMAIVGNQKKYQAVDQTKDLAVVVIRAKIAVV
jgi:hypothetical protein